MSSRLLVLSDLHISPPGPLATFHQGPALVAFIRAAARPDTTLVLAGDVLDLLQVEPRPPALDMPGASALLRRALDEMLADALARRDHPSAEDRAAIARDLPDGSGPRFVVYGHTHAAREIDLGGGRVYLDCGTWMDLMKLPDLADDAEVKEFIERLEAEDVPRERLRTYVEVTEDGAALRDWPAG